MANADRQEVTSSNNVMPDAKIRLEKEEKVGLDDVDRLF